MPQASSIVFPDADYTGIDVKPDPGRLFTGNRERVTLRTMLSAQLLAERPQSFDLVIVIDVLHHLPEHDRAALLADAAELTAEGGLIVVMDRVRGRTLTDAFTYIACRYIAADPNVRFMSATELRRLIYGSLPKFTPVVEAHIPPRRNNTLLAMRRQDV